MKHDFDVGFGFMLLIIFLSVLASLGVVGVFVWAIIKLVNHFL